MKRVQYFHYGGPEELRLRELRATRLAAGRRMGKRGPYSAPIGVPIARRLTHLVLGFAN
jgi:hypothetical protein